MGVDVGRGLSARRHALGKCHPNPTSELQATARAHGHPRPAHRLTRCPAVRLASCVACVRPLPLPTTHCPRPTVHVACCMLHLPRCLARCALYRLQLPRLCPFPAPCYAANINSSPAQLMLRPFPCPALACFGPSAIHDQDHLSLYHHHHHHHHHHPPPTPDADAIQPTLTTDHAPSLLTSYLHRAPYPSVHLTAAATHATLPARACRASAMLPTCWLDMAVASHTVQLR
jgi:hypothetical protein